MELFQELNQKFQTLDRFRDIPNMGSMVSKNDWRGSRAMPQALYLGLHFHTHMILVQEVSDQMN